LADEGLASNCLGPLDPAYVRVARTASRSVLGFMNDMASMSESIAGQAGGVTCLDVEELRQRAREILEITDDACHTHLNAEYAQCCRVLVGRLARKRPSPLARGDARIWAAGAIYATGQVSSSTAPKIRT